MDRYIFFFIFSRYLIDGFFLMKRKLQYLDLTSRRKQKLEEINFTSRVGHNKATIYDIIQDIYTNGFIIYVN
jgi:hypothetical protein